MQEQRLFYVLLSLTFHLYFIAVAEHNSSKPKPFQLRIVKILCMDQPYKHTIVHHCKTVVRRNQPTLLNLSVTIPEVINFGYINIKIEYKFNETEGCQFLRNKPDDPLSKYIYGIFEETLPTIVTPCPHGNIRHFMDNGRAFVPPICSCR
uniref:Spaetzle domain-containing protein n=1 Tax=Anopheles minimus TaxID=112268 RepID=A0A182W836_9DIPT